MLNTLNYMAAKEMWLKARDQSKGKPIGRNLRIVKCGTDFGVMLHNTVIIRLHSEGGFTLNSGGWHTHTTKKHMNAFLKRGGMAIIQRKWAWYLKKGKKTMTYSDNIRFDGKGEMVAISYERQVDAA